MAAKDEQPKSGMRLWVKLLFAGSLALNLLVIGAIGGAAAFGDRWKSHRMGKGPGMGGGPLTHALAHEDRRAIGKAMRQAGREGGGRAAHMEQLRGFVQVLRAEPFDPAAAAVQLEGVMAHGQARLTAAKSALADHLAQMTPDARAAYADRLEEILERCKDGRCGKHKRH